MIRLELPNPVTPVSVNDLGDHWTARAENARQWRNTTYLLARSWRNRHHAEWQQHVNRPCRVDVIVGVGVHRTRDPINYSTTVVKPIVDGLVEAGLWPDDHPAYVTQEMPTFHAGDTTSVIVRRGTPKIGTP